MQITTWNVNGLRAVMRKEALNWVFETGMDVIGLQEIKSREEQLTKAQLELLADPSYGLEPC